MRKLLLCFCAGIIMYALGYIVPGNSSSFYQSTSYSASSGLYKNGGLVYSIPGEYNSSDRGEYYLGVKYICQVHDFMYGDFDVYAVWLSQAWTGNAPSGRFVVPSRVNNHDIVGLGGGALSGSEITTLVCNSNIRVIMSEVCKDCKRLESVELPSTINEISYGVFKGCIELGKIDVPINVMKIGGEAFYGCSKLTTVSLSAKITDVGKDAFSGCSALDSVTFAGAKPTGIDKCGIREKTWINISKSNYSGWKDCGYRLLVTQTAIDPSSAIKLRKSLANQMDGITTIVSEVDDASISEVINGTAVPITRRDSDILYISNAGVAYSVKFNANGGSGTMSNQSFVYGTAQNLTANGFSRAGYSFVGWATSANGTKVYSDKESVKNLTSTANGTVNLYAVWESILGIENVISRQRYPWNGLVDIDVTVKGVENEDYLVSLVARDLDGGTNLPLRTAWQLGGTVTNNAFLVKPGAHRFTWDAAADITNDSEFANVVVNVSAEHSAIIGAKKVLTLEVADYAGTETLANMPILVRLSTAINGFSYADFVDTNGGDLIFADESGSIVYPHEIDEWHTDGESLVWVKLPQMVNGTKFKMAYGNSKFITQNSQLSSHDVWSDYAGVWHMNEDSETAYDSTANGLNGTPSKGTNELADISQMVAYENGACGRARVNGAMNGSSLNYMRVPASRKFYFGGHFVVSGWFMANDIAENDDPRLISKKNGMSYAFKNKAGFEINYENALTNLLVRGQGTSNFITNTPSILNSWVNLVVVFSGTNVTVYANGKNVGSGIISEVLDNDDYLTLGGGDDPYSLNGQYDEIRLHGGTLSADWIKADYDMIVNRNFLRYGPVENGKGTAE